MTETPDAQLSADADAAADQLEQHGWRQGQLWDGGSAAPWRGGRTCALGASRVATGVAGWRTVADIDESRVRRFDRLVSALQSSITSDTGSGVVSWWNDAHGRTAQEVIDAFRDVAVKHRPDAYRSGGAG